MLRRLRERAIKLNGRALPGQPLSVGRRYFSPLAWFARGGALFVAALGALVVAGWVLHVDALTRIAPGFAPMTVNTACSFVAAGLALWLLQVSAAGSQPWQLARVLSVFVAMLGAATLVEGLSGIRIGVDRLILRGDLAAVTSSGAVSPLTEAAFIGAGLALILLKAREARLAPFAQVFALVPLAVSIAAIAGHAFGAAALVQAGRYAAIAPQAAAAFLILALATLAADATRGFAHIAVSDTSGGAVCRRLLWVVPVALLGFGWAGLKSVDAGLLDYRFAFAAALLGAVALLAGLVALVAVTLHRTDLKRKAAMAQIRALNEQLDRQEEERKRELAKSMAELSEANKRLEELSQHDGLTGVANRAYFDKYLDSQIAIARRHNRSVALILCDVDSFKTYNDHYGHQAGDECLKQVAAALLSASKRTADVVARYGGEEFAIILPETGIKGAMRVAEAARAAVAQARIPHAYSPAGPFVSISGGVAAIVWQGDATARQLIGAADKLLYEAKRQGRNRMIAAQPVAA